MNVQQYVEIRRTIPIDAVAFGYQTVTLIRDTEIDEAQKGYSISASNEALSGDKEGDWRASWLVIGYEGLLGDPVLVDLSMEHLPVFTAMHGEGEWNPVMIASSYQGFVQALTEVEQAARDRHSPAQLERNPLPEVERQLTLGRITKAIGNGDLAFWESWLEG